MTLDLDGLLNEDTEEILDSIITGNLSKFSKDPRKNVKEKLPEFIIQAFKEEIAKEKKAMRGLSGEKTEQVRLIKADITKLTTNRDHALDTVKKRHYYYRHISDMLEHSEKTKQ